MTARTVVLLAAGCLLAGCSSRSPSVPLEISLSQAGRGILYPANSTGLSPAVLIVPGEAGITPGVQQMAQTLHSHGYRVLIVDLYRGEAVAQGDPLDAHIMSRALDEQQVANDLRDGLAYLQQQPGPLALLGFDLGGAYALEAAIRQPLPALKLVISIGGRPVTDAAKLAPLQASVLVLYGAKDEGIPAEAREAFRAALAQAGKRLLDMPVFERKGDNLLNPPSEADDLAALDQILATLQSELR
ncbi:MAG: dienelactone hydrolase family protein [Gemmataceae bacterium]